MQSAAVHHFMGMSEMLAAFSPYLRNWAMYHPRTLTNGLDNLTVMSDCIFSMSQNAMRRPEKRSDLMVMRILGRKAYSLHLLRMRLASPMLSLTIYRRCIITILGNRILVLKSD